MDKTTKLIAAITGLLVAVGTLVGAISEPLAAVMTTSTKAV